MSKSKWLASFIVAGASTLAPAAARAADISVYVSDSFIKNKIDGAITGYIQSQASQFAWLSGVTHVSTDASGVNDSTLHVRLSLSFNAGSIIVPVYLDFDVVLDCGENGPYATLDDLAVTTLVPVPPQIGALIQSQANAMLASKSQAIITPIWNQLGSLPTQSVARQVCPHFEVGPSGDLYVEVDFRRGCINDREKFVTCGSRYTGGHEYSCVNGYWQKMSGWCEPAAPPGGHRP
jgi:hypothetical protein